MVAENVPWLVGGSADLAGSDKTRLKFEGAGDFQPGSYGGRNLHFGVREHGMAASVNGMAVCKIRPFGGTFFNFSDYMRPSIRLAALMEIPTIYVFTRTIQSAWAKTARLINRSNNWPRCALCRD